MHLWLERFEEKYEPEPNSGCWLWIASLDGKGYGQFPKGKEFGRGNVRAHRAAYEIYRGPIPKGMELDHLCRVKTCVNPAHLEPVPHQVNMVRGLRTTYVRTPEHRATLAKAAQERGINRDPQTGRILGRLSCGS